MKKKKEVEKQKNKKIITNDKEQSLKFENLLPIDDVKIGSESALKYSFKSKNITNIAITGNYSSGKSSILKSFIKKEKIKNYTIISLAKLSDKQENKAEGGNETVEGNEVGDENNEISSQIIEKAIIDQLYYDNLNLMKRI